MYKMIVLLACLITLNLHGENCYFICIEGGATKTILQVMNQKGHIVSLIKDGVKSDRIETTGSNINSIGVQGVRQVLNLLVERVYVTEEDCNTELRNLIPSCRVVAGMAGLGLIQNQQSLISLIEELGVSRERILVMSDADMVLQLIKGDGIILIAGTGSICLGKRDGKLFRVGGLGRVLGDEGSGYQVGLLALKAAIAEEYGWGTPTTLTASLKKHFAVTELKSLIPKITLGELPASKIASCAPLVFDHAYNNDQMAQKIINKAAEHLSDLLINITRMSDLHDCEVHLWGGIFKNAQSEMFIQKIKENLPAESQNLKLINKSKDNPATLYIIKEMGV